MESVVEIIYQWCKGVNLSRISRSLGFDRKTVRKYIELAEAEGLSRDSCLPSPEHYAEIAGRIQKSLKTPAEHSASHRTTSFYQNTIHRLLGKPYMNPKQVYRILRRDHGYRLSYSSFNRYIKVKYPRQPANFIRIETDPGEEAQVDFGSAGMMFDPETERNRRAYAFVMTLSYSRLSYVEFVFDQGQSTWVRCHVNAFEFFCGVPKRIILDNLKSGVLKPNTYDPVLNRAYAECAKYYGFIADPAKVSTPRHKGKVERRIPVIRSQFISTYDNKDISDANNNVRQWCLDEYGMQVHGTTKRKPFEVFKFEEQPRLMALPAERFDIPIWKEAKVHPDHHLVFLNSYYSMPTRYVGRQVWVRATTFTVQIFHDFELIKTHPRASKKGVWATDEKDYPPEKSSYILKSVSYYLNKALQYGSHVHRVVEIIISEHAYRNLRKIQAIFRFADKFGSQSLDLSCKRCLHYQDYRIATLKRILEKELYLQPLEEEPVYSIPNSRLEFMRQADYFNHTAQKRENL